MRKSPVRALRSQHIAFIAVLLITLALVLSACQVPDSFVASQHASASSTAVLAAVSPTALPGNVRPGWRTFTDRGDDGFTISYPASWAFAAGYDPAHSSIVNPATSTVFSPLVSTVQQSLADVIARATPAASDQAQLHMTVTRRQVAGYPAVDVFAPYIPTTFHAPNSGCALVANRTVVMAVKNNAGTTNVYTFFVALPVDKSGNMSAAVVADGQTVDEILATFQLPPVIGPVAQG